MVFTAILILVMWSLIFKVRTPSSQPLGPVMSLSSMSIIKDCDMFDRVQQALRSIYPYLCNVDRSHS